MSTRIENNKYEVCDLSIKRAYLPFKVISTCPNCSKEVVRDVSSDYLSYPKVNDRVTVCMYCEIEEMECCVWDVEIIIRVTAEVA